MFTMATRSYFRRLDVLIIHRHGAVWYSGTLTGSLVTSTHDNAESPCMEFGGLDVRGMSLAEVPEGQGDLGRLSKAEHQAATKACT